MCCKNLQFAKVGCNAYQTGGKKAGNLLARAAE
jgi:hypothetical protein